MACDVGAEHIGPCCPDCILFDYLQCPDKPPAQQHFLAAVRHSEMPNQQQWQHVMDWAEEWQEKVDTLTRALTASLFLQSHYAKLLNDYDGGLRLTFDSPQAWIDRLEETRKLREDANL